MQPRNFREIVAGSLGMDDSAPCGHEIHCPRADGLHDAQAVAVNDFPVEQVGNGGDADMRVRTHGYARSRREFGGPHVIEKHERTHHSAFA